MSAATLTCLFNGYAGQGWRNRIVLASWVTDQGLMPSPGNQRWLWASLPANNTKSSFNNECTLVLKPIGRVHQSLKQRIPVAQQNGPRSNKKNTSAIIPCCLPHHGERDSVINTHSVIDMKRPI